MKPPQVRDRVRNAREGGQAVVLVGIAMVSLLAMAGLAIDLTTLYVAHGEIQRAADAAALAGAKAVTEPLLTSSNAECLGQWPPGTQTPIREGTTAPAQQGLQCLTHKPQQDSLFPVNGMMQIEPGSYSQARYNVAPGSLISTSDSIITFPLFDLTKWNPGSQQVTIVGFLQLFVTDIGGAGQADMSGAILNVIGCGQSVTGGSAISGGGVSAIPVRLIHN
jgi:hypothetical protein